VEEGRFRFCDLLRMINYSDGRQHLRKWHAQVAVIRSLFRGSRALATGRENPAIPQDGMAATKARASQSSRNNDCHYILKSSIGRSLCMNPKP